MIITTKDIASIINGKLTGKSELVVTDLLTDSRHFSFSEGSVFFAIRGINHDGHIFINILFQKGIRIFIVNRLPDDLAKYPDTAFITTDNTIEALQKIAAFKRKMFGGTVIAVTGSAGKTVVKEWLADIIGLSVAVIRSPKSFNSQIGVPLSVWKLDEKYKTGIFEAGISLPGEMDKLQRIIDPDIGVLTNIGDAHQENFPDLRTKTTEKLKLFKNASYLIYCSDQEVVENLIYNDISFKSKNLIAWSFKNKKAAIFVKKRSLPGGRTKINVKFNGLTNEFIIPFSDRASIENAVSVTAVCLVVGIKPEIIRKGLAGIVSVAMRMELKNGINNCFLIEDYYNSDPGSLSMAIEYLKSQNNRKSTLILSDFIQSGRDETDLYKEVAGLLKRAGIDKLIGIGNVLLRNKTLFEKNARFFNTTDEFVRSFNGSDFRNEIILLKGARVYEFEKIGRLLEQQVHQTVLEINLDAISHNLNEFRRYLNQGTRIMAMVKAFAYGSGPAEIAGLLEYHRVDYLAVAFADEGVDLRVAGVTLPIMIMNPEPSAYDLIIKYNLEPEIYSLATFNKFTGIASKHGIIQYPVHIKIDSGMHRLGFMHGDIEKLADKIKTSESVKIISVFSHLAASEEPSLDNFTHYQVDLFRKAFMAIRSATGYPFLTHLLNSSGVVRFPQYQFDMVRLGIGIYGVGEIGGLNLKNAGRFITRISQVKEIPAGEPVGYGCADVSDSSRIIAILPVGYADGLDRKLGNRKGNMVIKGKRVPIIGNICMDMCMVDITGLAAKEDDEAEIFGVNITVDEVASICETIPYEILTSIPGRVKRVFYRE